VPPYGCFATVYKNRCTLQDRSLDLPFDQGIFISIAKHNGVICNCVSDGSRIIVTRQNLAFDPHLYLFHLKPLSASAWQTFHNLTQAAAQGSTQQATPSTKQPAAQKYISSESDIDDLLCTEIQEVNDTITEEKADKQDSSESDLDSDENCNENTRISSRQRRPSAIFKARYENPIAARKTNLLKHYNSDKDYSDDRFSLFDIDITKRFPGHSSFNGKISEYHPASDNYSITYQDSHSEVMSHSDVVKYVKGTKQYKDHHDNQLALYSVFHTAVSCTMSQSDNVSENYKDARATPDVAD